jgi:hypothetical protein
MNSVRSVGIDAVENKQGISEHKEIYILLGEIKRNQEIGIAHQEKTDRRIETMEKKINYAIGVVAAVIFFFQAGWTYITKMGKA